MATAAKVWKEYKSDLKADYFDPTLTEEELMANHDERVNEVDWKWLIDFWRSAEFKARSIRGKANRARLQMLHTSGSKNHPRVGHEMGEILGHSARRDEVWIETHTRKNGERTSMVESFTKQLQEAAEKHPELKERSIHNGELFSTVFGEREPRGRVRVLGAGPTPQDVGTPGARSKMPTRLQIEIEAHRQTEQHVVSLTQRMDKMEQQMNRLQQQLLVSQGLQNVETPSQHGSTSRNAAFPTIEQEIEAMDNMEQQYHSDEDGNDHVGNMVDDDDEGMVVHKRVVAPRAPPRDVALTRRNHEESWNEVGKDVILYAVTRPDVLVAKATITSTNPSTSVGGEALGVQFYEVVVNVVLKRDALLPRPYDGMETMADAAMMSIAWPINNIKSTKKPTMPKSAGGGYAGRMY